jgi:hypothetical protein
MVLNFTGFDSFSGSTVGCTAFAVKTFIMSGSFEVDVALNIVFRYFFILYIVEYLSPFHKYIFFNPSIKINIIFSYRTI